MFPNITRSRAAATVALAFVLPSPLSAQDAAADARTVAQCLVAENSGGQDWGAILDVLTLRARRSGWPLAEMARRYCAVHRAAMPTKRQAFIRALPTPDAPRRLRWSFGRALDAVRRGAPGTCTAEHWGDRGHDFARATRLGWTLVDCGATINAFWSRPPRPR